MIRSGANVANKRQAIEISESYLPKTVAAELSNRAREFHALRALETARQFLARRDIATATAQIREGLKCSQSFRVAKSLIRN